MCIGVEKQGAAVSFTHAPLTLQHTGSPGTEWCSILVSGLLSWSVFASLYLQTIHRTDLSRQESELQTWIIASILGTSCPSFGWGFTFCREEKDLRTGGIFNVCGVDSYVLNANSMQQWCVQYTETKDGTESYVSGDTHTSYNGESQSWNSHSYLAWSTFQTALIVDFKTFYSAKLRFNVCYRHFKDRVCVCMFICCRVLLNLFISQFLAWVFFFPKDTK